MSDETERDKGATGEPSLSDMVATAIKVLQKDDKGYFLFIEGKRVYYASIWHIYLYPTISSAINIYT